jgi:hypothetical protein
VAQSAPFEGGVRTPFAVRAAVGRAAICVGVCEVCVYVCVFVCERERERDRERGERDREREREKVAGARRRAISGTIYN